MKRSFVTLVVLVGLGILFAACQPATVAPAATQAPAAAVVASATPLTQPTDVPQADRVQIYWYIGLGTGSQAAQIPPEKAFVEKFNASQDKIQLITIIVDNKFAPDNLIPQEAASTAPNISGPMS